MGKIGVLTSGGDAPGMNPAVRAVVKTGVALGHEVVGFEDGYEGLLDGRTRALDLSFVDPIGPRGGTVLGTARSKRFRDPEGRAQAAAHLDGYLGLMVIGGNGSLTGAHLLGREHGVHVVGMPASIDNDIGCTAFCIGVDTALNTIVEACDRIADTATSHRRAFIVEVMGRDCGYLAMAAASAVGADAVLVPEQRHDGDEVVARVVEAVEKATHPSRNKRRVIIIKAEGVPIPCTRLARLVGEAVPHVTVRGTVLGHVVRGGSPSYQDRALANRLGWSATHALCNGAKGVMAAWNSTYPGGSPTRDRRVRLFELGDVLEETERLLDGTSEVTRSRMRLIQEGEGTYAL